MRSDTAKLKLFLASLQHDQTVEKLNALIVANERVLADKAVLADEMSHRVRNNFQLVEALLIGHRRILSTPEQRTSIDAIIVRIETLTTMYNQLLGAGMGRTIDLGKYIASLCGGFADLQRDPKGKVKLICITERLLVGIDIAIVVGMAVAEAVTNSYKHAIHDDNGTINVGLRRSEAASDEAILTINDNGPGFVEQPGSKRHGMSLIRRLVQQVDGTAELDSEQGAAWTFRFPIEAVAGLSPP